MAWTIPCKALLNALNFLMFKKKAKRNNRYCIELLGFLFNFRLAKASHSFNL